MPLVGGFGCLELVLYGIRELALQYYEPLILLQSEIFPGGGKVVGTMCAVFGVLVIGLPIPIIGSSFNNFYAREKRREKMTLERARQEAAVTAARWVGEYFRL